MAEAYRRSAERAAVAWCYQPKAGGSEVLTRQPPDRVLMKDGQTVESLYKVTPLYAHPSGEQAVRVPREFAARVRPAVKEWDIRCAQSVLKWERGEYPAHYEKLLKDEAERARVLLDEIDTILAEKEEAQ